MISGYARISPDGQSVDAQVAALTVAGREKVFQETASGMKSDRAQLRRVLAPLGPGGVLLVTRLDRLACSTLDLLKSLAAITSKEAGFRSLDNSWADTTTPHGRLLVTILGGLAEFDREMILSRTAEGRRHARTRGVRMGRKPKLTPHQQGEALKRRADGEDVTAVARSLNVSHSTISRLTRPVMAGGWQS